MRLLKCHVENFGKLQNFDYDFTEGLNTIKKDNGFGKTTFADFIKAMFYGLETSKAEKTDRKRYMPWQGGKFGGNIDFEVNNKKYRIERFFEKKAADDSFKLYDLETNLESSDYTENIGEEIFKINKGAFERSTYIPQGKIQIEMDDSINAKLGNVLESENDVNTSEIAIKRITEAMKIYKKTGGRGLIYEKINRLNELRRELEKGKTYEQVLDERKNKLTETVNEIKQKEQEKTENQKVLNEKMKKNTNKEKLERYNMIIKKLEEAQKAYDELDKFFEAGIPTDQELEILSTKCLEVEKYKGEMANFGISKDEELALECLNKKYEGKQISINEIDKKITDYNEIRDIENKFNTLETENTKLKQKTEELEEKVKSNKKIFSCLLIISLIMIVGGLIFVINQNNIGIISAVIGIIFVVIAVLKNAKSKEMKNEIKKQEDEVNALDKTKQDLNIKKENIENEVEKFIKQFISNYEDKIIALTEIKTEFNRYNDMKLSETERVKRNEEVKEKVDLLEESIKKYLYDYFDSLDKSYSILVHEIKLQKNELNRVKKELKEEINLKQEFEKQNNMEDLNNTELTGIEVTEKELYDSLKALDAEIDKLNDEKNQNKNQIEVLENRIDDLQDFETEAENLEEEIKVLEEKYDILAKTKEYMQTAKERFSSHYLNGMIQEFENYFKMLDDKNIETSVDINLGVNIEAYGAKKDVKYLSAGYQDLIYICMRFSLVKALFEDELPFVVLDDPFVNLDDEKTKKCIDLLNKISENYQVIYMVCNQSRT